MASLSAALSAALAPEAIQAAASFARSIKSNGAATAAAMLFAAAQNHRRPNSSG
jgi:hypothetical protein